LGAISVFWFSLAASVAGQTDRRGEATLSPADRLRLRRTPVVEVFDACKDSVVNISTTQIIEMRSPFDDFDRLFEDLFDFPAAPRLPQQFKSSAVGSGFVVHPAGYVVTNAHVVARTAKRTVIFANKLQYDAQIVSMDTRFDLAILKIEADGPLAPIPFGRSDDLLVGETVIAIGNPLGLQNTVTTGVISALDRTLEVNRTVIYSGLIQTDAPINPGNSGGPLLNVLGALIGVNTAIRGDAQNIGFAIPVDQLTKALPRMLDVERRYRIETGLQLREGTPPSVSSVTPDSPAERAGLRVADALTHVENDPITKVVDFDIALIGRKPHDQISIRFRRDARTLETKLILAPKPRPNGERLAREMLGVDVQPLGATVARRLGLRSGEGLSVIRVMPDGPAARVGIEPADILLAIDGRAVSSLDDLGLVLERFESGQPVRITVLRLTPRALFQSTVELVIP
jgi:serine protease Do